jgi:uncharacterized protein
MRTITLILLIITLIVIPVYADDFLDGYDAYDRGDYKTALDKIKPLAEKGGAVPQYLLGKMYYEGQGVDKNYKEAFKLILSSAEKEVEKSLIILIDMYTKGHGIKKDLKEAAAWKVKLIRMRWRSHKSFNMMMECMKLVEGKERVTCDAKRKAEMGDAGEQFHAGALFENGNIVYQDHKEAAKWYGKAAEKGLVKAQYRLGNMYFKGLGVPKDYVQAHKWFNIAGANGNADGRNTRDTLEKKMTSEQIAEAQKLAREWMEENK